MIRKSLVADAQSELNSADVGGVLHDLLHRQQPEAFPVVNDASKNVDDAILAIDQVRWIRQPLFKSRSRRDDLECRPGSRMTHRTVDPYCSYFAYSLGLNVG